MYLFSFSDGVLASLLSTCVCSCSLLYVVYGACAILLQLDLVCPFEPFDPDPGETVRRGLTTHLAPRLDRRRTNVGQDDNLCLSDQRVVARDVGFALDHVESGPGESTLSDRFDERVRIDDGSPGRVDDVRGRFHPREELSTDDAARLSSQRATDDEEVRFARQLVQRLGRSHVDAERSTRRLDPEIVLVATESFADSRGRVQDALDPEPEQPFQSELANLAEPENSDRTLTSETTTRRNQKVSPDFCDQEGEGREENDSSRLVSLARRATMDPKA